MANRKVIILSDILSVDDEINFLQLTTKKYKKNYKCY